MKQPSLLIATLLFTFAACATTSPASIEAEAKALVGTRYRPALMGQPIAPGKSSCMARGAGVLSDQWAYSTLRCQGHVVLTLDQSLGNGQWQFVDVLVVPGYKEDPETKKPASGLTLTSNNCDIDGGAFTQPFYALVRWDKRRVVTGKSGIQRAWIFDTELQRIVPLSVHRIECERFDS